MKIGAEAEVSYSAVPVDIKSSCAVLNICHGAIVSNFSSHESSVFSPRDPIVSSAQSVSVSVGLSSRLSSTSVEIFHLESY